jgi:hypothetical protein
MGDWAIVVVGTGCHHNGKPEIDANLAAEDFVRRLRSQGHTIVSATFTKGGRDDLLNKVMDNSTFSIQVNGRPRIAPGLLSYYDAVDLAEHTGTPTVLYTKSRSGGDGILKPGDVVHVTNGTRFEVQHTGNA